MKQSVILLVLASCFSCGDKTHEASAPVKKVVCGDSVEQEMFDESGNHYLVRMPGKCDTVLVTEEEKK